MLLGYDQAGHETSNVSGMFNAQGQIPQANQDSNYSYSYKTGNNTAVALLQSQTYLDPVGHINMYLRTYTYDSQNRLLQGYQTIVGSSTMFNNFTYTYDNNGNMLSRDVASSNLHTTNSYGPANKLIQV